MRREQEERVDDVVWMAKDERGLPEVGDQHGGEHDREPGEPDRSGAEVAAVGVQRLGTGDAEHDASEREPPSNAVLDHEARAPDRRERLDDFGMRNHLRETEPADHREEEEDDRSEGPAHRAGAESLDGEQAGEDDEGDRDDEVH